MPQATRNFNLGESINFLLTNRIPRRLATRFMGWYAGIESPTLTRFSLWIWRLFANDLQLHEARETRFGSLQACFTRQLREGARPVDPRPDTIVSPCDGLVGAMGRVENGRLYQAKGYPYELSELIPDPALREKYRDGLFATLRLTSSMYHRFHAPVDCRVQQVTYLAGDTWNVNPVALQRIEKLYCRNERAVIDLVLDRPDQGVCLVPVAAILVASIRLHCLGQALDMHYRGPQTIDCQGSYRKGEELGYFQHGSTLIVFATGQHRFRDGLASGQRVCMGEALLHSTDPIPSHRQESPP